MDILNTQQLIKMYQTWYQQHGNSPTGVGWDTKETQEKKFQSVLSLFRNTKTPQILDLGCGLGHFYDYLAHKGFTPDYHGIDLVPEFVEFCRIKGLEVEEKDLRQIQGLYDFVVAFGTFHYTINDSLFFFNLFEECLKAILPHVRKYFVFTLLKQALDQYHISTKQKLKEIFKKIGITQYEIQEDPEEFIIFLNFQYV